MESMIDGLVAWMTGLPAGLVYLVIGVFAALENVVPPVPADVIALLGGFLTGRGPGEPWIAFVCVWLGNVAGAMGVYAVGRRYGTRFFRGRIGRMLLHEHQMRKLADFYGRYGQRVILVSRFLPGFRAVVPIFAGTAGVSVVRTLLPVALASAAWYGALIYLGATAGENWDQIRGAVNSAGRWLVIPAIVAVAGVAWWWWRTRRGEHVQDTVMEEVLEEMNELGGGDTAA